MVINNPSAHILYGCPHLRIHGHFGWHKFMALTAISIVILFQNGKYIQELRRHCHQNDNTIDIVKNYKNIKPLLDFTLIETSPTLFLQEQKRAKKEETQILLLFQLPNTHSVTRISSDRSPIMLLCGGWEKTPSYCQF